MSALPSELSVVVQQPRQIPNPHDLAEYERIYPGAAKQFFKSDERRAQHLMSLEQKALDASIAQNVRLLNCITLVALVAILTLGCVVAIAAQSIPYLLGRVSASVAVAGGRKVWVSRAHRASRDKQQDGTVM